ncbi:hypothetical protein E2320_002036, partial [Naja naja]
IRSDTGLGMQRGASRPTPTSSIIYQPQQGRGLFRCFKCNQPGHQAAECLVPPLRVPKQKQLPIGCGRASDRRSLVEGAAYRALLGMIDDLSPSAHLQEPSHPANDRYFQVIATAAASENHN